MQDLINNIPTILLSAFVMLLMSGVTLFLARKSGLTDVQVAVKNETNILIETYQKRIDLLEEEVADLKSKYEALEIESKKDKRELTRLRKYISDFITKNADELT